VEAQAARTRLARRLRAEDRDRRDMGTPGEIQCSLGQRSEAASSDLALKAAS
jgi:hypothetical protein